MALKTKEEKDKAKADAAAAAPASSGVTDDAPAGEENVAIAPYSADAQGEFSASDINWPRFQIMQKTSKPVENGSFTFLDAVVGGEVKVASPTLACELVVIGMRKFYEENVPFEEQRMPLRWATEAAAKAAGMTTEWVGNTRPDAGPKLVAAILVKHPEHAEGKEDDSEGTGDTLAHFPFNYDDAEDELNEKMKGDYALVMLEMKGSGYTSMAKPMITACSGARLKKQIQIGRFKLKTVKKVQGANSYGAGVLSLTSFNSPKFATWAATLLQAS